MQNYMQKYNTQNDTYKPMVYVSGAISGVDTLFARAEFNLAEEEAHKLYPGYSVYNPYVVGAGLPKDWTYDQIMNLDLAVLEDCEVIYMMDNWQMSKGAKIEHDFAKSHNIEIVYQKDMQKNIYKNKEIERDDFDL